MPYDKGLIEKAPLLEVFDQPGDGFVDFPGMQSVVFDQVTVSVPVVDVVSDVSPVVELNESHPAFNQTSGQQTLSSERFRLRGVHPVKPFCGLVFVGQIDRLRRTGLHAVSQLVGGDSGGQFRTARVPPGVFFIQPAQMIQSVALPFRSH